MDQIVLPLDNLNASMLSIKKSPKRRPSVVSRRHSRPLIRNSSPKKKNFTDKKKFTFVYDENGKIHKKTLETENSKTSLSLPKRNSPALLYIPKTQLKFRSSKKNFFSEFAQVEGGSEFLSKSARDMPPNTLRGMSERLSHNKSTRSQYLKHYTNLHKRTVSDVSSQLKNWQDRFNNMPEIKIRSKRKNGQKATMRFNMIKNKLPVLAFKEFSREERKDNIRDYNFAWRKVEEFGTLQAREGSSICCSNGEAWLIGGISEKPIDEAWVLNLKTEVARMIHLPEDFGAPRFNHTAVGYKGLIFIFGGEKMRSNNYDTRTRLNDIIVLEPSTYSIQHVPPARDFIQPRRNHVAIRAGIFMMVHGGIDQNDLTLNDLWTFNLESKSWFSPQTEGVLPMLSHHGAASVFTYPDKVTEIYRKKEYTSKDRVKITKI